ncbi:arylamine N-acetyltransferase [Bacillus thuringiensis]|nr:arylamine N-acetyltransferase [Bacillus thuringiensis]MED3182506.1 arylamine N-acetyltransferase [Bacillus thuringiensis]
MEGNKQEFSRENNEEKLLVKNRSGLCYEINSLLYYFCMIVDLMCIE